MKVLLSNGSYRFHLAPLAVELSHKGILQELLVAAWPIGWQRALCKPFIANKSVMRFLDRAEHIDPKLVKSLPSVEAMLKAGDYCRKFSKQFQQKLHVRGYHHFALSASARLKELRPNIYHYRCAYGQQSITTARELGIPALCDHSIAHPSHIDYLVDNIGVFPKSPLHPFMPLDLVMEQDIIDADYLIVNSDFVRQSCQLAGVPKERIFVVYLGIDEKFYSHIPLKQSDAHQATILYAGSLEKRKGIFTLISALEKLKCSCQIYVAGGIDPELENNKTIRDFLGRRNVDYLGTLSRSALAQAMFSSSIFVFPSYCEGSARVIFEAMAAGCFIITTPNSGSIVKHGDHGFLVPPGDPIALSAAIDEALSKPKVVALIGSNNAELIRSQYRQNHYAENVINVYNTILK